MIVAILAGGPSLNQQIVNQVMSFPLYSIAINNAWLLAPDADVLLAADAEWWQEYPEALSFKGQKIVMQDQRIAGAMYVPPETIGLGSNSALQGAYYAMKKGATCTLLFGVDLRDDELSHHHGRHRGKLGNPKLNTFRRARAAWDRFAAEKRPNVINCNPRSAVNCFPKMTPEEALCLACM